MEIALTLFVIFLAVLAWKMYSITCDLRDEELLALQNHKVAQARREATEQQCATPASPRKQYSYWPNPAMQPMPAPPQARVMPTPPRGTVRRECDAPPRPAAPPAPPRSSYAAPAPRPTTAAASSDDLPMSMYGLSSWRQEPASAPEPDRFVSGGGGDFGGGGATSSWGDSSSSSDSGSSSSDSSSSCSSD